jgi:hypothetical protein
MLCQTTDSGPNNNTMAEEMHTKLALSDKNGDFEWDHKTMHIKCFCHKMALVVNAGVKELGLQSPPPPKMKKVFLGSFPYSSVMPKITEENEGDNEDSNSNNEVRSDHTKEDDTELDDDNKDDPDESQEPNTSANNGQTESSSKANRNNSNDLNELVTAVSHYISDNFL